MHHAVQFLFVLLLLPRLGEALSCWDETLGFSEERCCSEQDNGCWTEQMANAGLTRTICCVLARSTEKLGERAATQLIGGFAQSVGIFVQYGPKTCSESVAHLITVLKEFPPSAVASDLQWLSMQPQALLCPSKVDQVDKMHFMLSALEAVVLNLRSEDPIAKSAVLETAILGEALHGALLRRSGSIWMQHARHFVQNSARSWGLLDRFPRPHSSEKDAMHIGLVASVGKPAFGAKAMASIRSALFFAQERPLVFHLVVDDEGELSMHRALATLEWWLKAKGTFQFHHIRTLEKTRQKVRDMVPHSCLKDNSRYGSIGWVRLFPHEVVDAAVDAVLWVDAGDFVFLDDPAKVLSYIKKFSSEQFIGAPTSHALPFQLFDMVKLRATSQKWDDMLANVAEEGFRKRGAEFCNLGEGFAVHALTVREDLKRIWYWMPSTWAFEPWADWLLGHGVKDIWSHRVADGQGFPEVWTARSHPGLESFMGMKIYCPPFTVSLITHILSGWTNSVANIASGLLRSRASHLMAQSNGTFGDSKNQALRCNEKVHALHFVYPFHSVPWVHRMLNFWAGSDVWSAEAMHREKRDLSTA